MRNLLGNVRSRLELGKSKSSQSATHRSRIFYGWLILSASFLTSVVAWGFYYAFGVFFQDLQESFNADRAAISIISSICICVILMMGPLYGWAIERYGSRKTVGLAGVILCAALLISSRATTVWQLYISLGFFTGLAISATVVPFITALARWFAKMRGLAIGIQSAGAGAGMMIVPLVSQRLLTSYGWRSTFVIFGIMSLVIFIVSAILLRESPEEKGLLPYGVTNSSGKDGAAEKQASATSVIGEKDLTLSEAMRTKNLWLVLGIKTALSMVIFMVNTHLVNFAKDAGVPAASAAALMTIVGALSIVGKVGAGHLADRIGSRIIVIFCAAIMGVWLFWLSSPMGTMLLPVSAIIYGLVYGGSFPVLNTIVAEGFGVTHFAKILGVVNVCAGVGSLVGPWLGGYVFDTMGSYSIAFIIAAGAAVMTVILAIQFGKRPQKSPKALTQA